MKKHNLITVVLLSILIAFLLFAMGCGGGSGTGTPSVIATPTQGSNPTSTPTQGTTGQYTFGAKYLDPSVTSNYPHAINPGASSDLPSSVDLSKYMPPIGDQGNLGSCVAWSVGYGMRSALAQKDWNWGINDTKHQASPAYLYGLLIQQDDVSCGDGTSPKTAMDILVKNGCNSLYVSPYNDNNCSYNLTAQDASNFKIKSYKAVDVTNRNAVKTELATYSNPVMFGAQLYTDFTKYTGGIYKGNGTILQNGAHAMVIIGYDDSKNAYRIQNSWGTKWGENGYMWIDYDTFEKLAFVGFVADTINTQPVEPNGPVATPTPSSGEPQGYIDDESARQFYNWWDGYYYIYVEYHFDRPVLVKTVTCMGGGLSGKQIYNFWYQDGYVYFYRVDRYAFTPGTYTFIFDIEDDYGQSYTLSGQTYFGYPSSAGASVKIRGKNVPVPDKAKYVEVKPFSQGIIYGMNGKPCEVKKVKER